MYKEKKQHMSTDKRSSTQPEIKNRRDRNFFVLNCFWWNRIPYCLYFPLPPLRGQPTAKCHPRWQPISGQQSTVGWGDCWIQTQDCSFTIWCRYQWATTAPIEPPLLPMSHHCSQMSHHCSTETYIKGSIPYHRGREAVHSNKSC